MSSRTVSVVLTAQVQNYLSNMRAAETRTLELERSTRNATEQFRAHNQAVQALGVGMLAAGTVAAAGIALAVKASAEFGSKMAQLQSLSHASAGTMKQLSDAAMSLGTAYGFSATKVADAEIELQKAGIGVAAQLGGALKGALTLAAAGQMDVASATEITTVAMTQFGLSAAAVPHLADLLAAGADKALGSVGDLGEALKNGGLQAHNMGLTIDDTVGTLSAFANSGILGAEAGTQLRSMFLRLQNPTKESKAVLDQYGISINDASGKFVGISKFAGELHDRLTTLKGTNEKLTDAQRNQALATVFGSHAIVGATVLYNAGAKGIGGWIDRVNEGGFASAQAAGKMNSLQGDAQKLAAVFQTDLIKSGSGANEALRHVTQTATGLLTAFSAIPGPVLDVGAGVTAVVAGVGLLGGAALIAVPKIVAFRTALTELGISGRQAAGTFAKGAGLTAGLVILGEGLAGLSQQGSATAQQIEQTGLVARKSFGDLDKLFQSTNALGGAASGFKNALDFEGLGSSVQKFGSLNGMISGLSATVLKNEGTFDALGQQLAGMATRDLPSAQQGFAGIVKQYGLTAGQTQKLLGLMPAYRDELVKQAGAAHISASDQNLLLLAQGKGTVSVKVLAAAQAAAATAAAKQADTLATLSGQASSATTSIDDLQKAIEGFGSAQLDARGATRAMYQAIDDATDAAKTNGRTLDVHTKAGRANAAALDGIASAADQAASKVLKQTGSTEKAQAVMQTARDAFIKTAGSMGLSGTQAARLADKLGLIPKNITTAVSATGFDTASAKAAALRDLLNSLHSKAITIDVSKTGNGANYSDSRDSALSAPRRAGGGDLDVAPGPKGVDSQLFWGAKGEHVFTAKEVDALGGQRGTYAFRARLDAGQVPHFAKGGALSVSHGSNSVARRTDSGTRKKRKAAPDPGAIAAQDAAAAAAKRQADAASKAIAAAQKRIKLQEKAAKAAQDRLQKAQDAAAKISGKGTAAAKHAATLRSREAAKQVKTANARVKATQKTIDTAAKTRDDARQRQQAAADAAQTLRENAEDFVSSERRGGQDPLGYVDQLRAMSRDGNYSKAQRASFDQQANDAEKTITAQMRAQDEYTKALDASTKTQDANKDALAASKQTLDDATSALDSLKSTAAQFASSISGSVSGKYSAASAVTAGTEATPDTQVSSGWFLKDGIRYQNTMTVPGKAADPGGLTTVGSLSSYYSSSANATGVFAGQLQKLAGKSIDRQLLAEIAGDGPEQGGAIAAALLAASDSDFRSINNNYAATLVNSDRAGALVSDYTYGSQIKDAQGAVSAAQVANTFRQGIVDAQQKLIDAEQASSDAITAALTGDGDSLKTVIGKAFRLPGYATGTVSASAGIRWVGEHGPELAGFRGGEAILTAPNSQRWIRGQGGGSAAPQVTVSAPQVRMPDTITVQDLHGFRATMRVVATQEIARNDMADAVLMMGGPA